MGSCEISSWDTKTFEGEIKRDVSGMIKEAGEVKGLDEELRKDIERFIEKIPEMQQKIRDAFIDLGISTEIIEQIIKSKYIVLVRGFQGPGVGTAEAIKIDGKTILVSAGHVVGGASIKRSFGGEVVGVYDMNGKQINVTEVYKDIHTDIGFIETSSSLPKSYNLDALDTEITKQILNTGSSSNQGIQKIMRNNLGLWAEIVIGLRGDGEIDIEKQIIIPNITEPGDSGSMIIQENGNPYCIVQAGIPGVISGEVANICGNISSIRESFRNYQLLKLKQDCEKVQ